MTAEARIQRNSRLLAWFNFLNDFRLYAPVQILYFAQVTGSFTGGMSIMSVTMLASALLEVPTGVFSDRIGRRRTVIVGAAASTVAIVGYALAGLLPAQGFLLLVGGAIIEGLSRAFFSGNNDALLYDTLAAAGQEAHFQDYLGRTASMFQFALASSAVLGGIVASVSFNLAMWLSIVPQVLSLIVSLGFIEPPVHSHTPETTLFAHLGTAFRGIVRNPRLRLYSAASIISNSVGEAAFQFRPVFVEMLWPLWAIGLARLISNLTAALSFYLSGRLIRRFGEAPMLYGSILYSETLNVLALIFPSVLSPALMGTTSIFFGVKNVAIGGLMQREFTSQQRATMGSLNAFATSLVFAPASLLLGLIADQFGVIAALLIASAVTFIPLLLYRLAFRQGPAAAAPVVDTAG